MHDLDSKQIRHWVEEMERHIAHLETRAKPIVDEIRIRRKKLDALRSLLEDDASASTTAPKPNPTIPPSFTGSVSSRLSFTPVYYYWVPILQSLVELGDSAPKHKVIELVGKKMQGLLKPADYEPLPHSPAIRWENRVAWQRLNMLRQGLLADNCPRGIWEITPKGRTWLEEQIKKIKERIA